MATSEGAGIGGCCGGGGAVTIAAASWAKVDGDNRDGTDEGPEAVAERRAGSVAGRGEEEGDEENDADEEDTTLGTAVSTD